MLKNKLRLTNYGRKLLIVMLMNFLIFPMYGEPQTEQQRILNKEKTRFYTDLEIDLLINDLTEAALEAIDQVAGEAARAATLSMLDREAVALREAQRWKQEAETIKRKSIKNNFVVGAICFLGGLAAGVTGVLIIRN